MSDELDPAALARLAFGAWFRTAGWTLGVARGALRGALGTTPPSARPAAAPPPPGGAGPAEPDPPDLRERGAELLRRSTDVGTDDDGHPAYELIVDQLTPDEARVLRLLQTAGPQPAVDVRSGTLPINVATELVEPGLTLLGAEAGCRHRERVPAYLNNLYRLGLIWFSREPLKDVTRYQVLEAQPDVVAALERAGRGRTVRRSIHLTPFGDDFCEVVLPPRSG